MRIPLRAIAVAVGVGLTARIAGAQSAKVQFIQVDRDVKLEVIDWGGAGRPVVLLAGNAQTAHSFDEFAPQLSSTNHVYGITRRGWGESSRPTTGYESDRLADDVLAVIDSLHLDRPVVAGHSFAGAELSSIGARHPEKVAGLVYLDAVFGYSFYTAGNFDTDENELRRSLEAFHAAGRVGNVEEMRRVLTRLLETDIPLLDRSLRAVLAATPAASSNPPQRFIPPVSPGVSRLMNEGVQRYTQARAPILAIQARAETTKATRRLMELSPTARIVFPPGATHFVFNSNRADVLREMRAFISGLR